MKNWNLLIPSLTLITTLPFVALTGCNTKKQEDEEKIEVDDWDSTKVYYITKNPTLRYGYSSPFTVKHVKEGQKIDITGACSLNPIGGLYIEGTIQKLQQPLNQKHLDQSWVLQVDTQPYSASGGQQCLIFVFKYQDLESEILRFNFCITT